MFTASLNLEALKQVTQGGRTCAAEGCQEPVSQEGEYCSAHSKGRAQPRQRKARKARR